MPNASLTVLGTFALHIDGQPVRNFPTEKARALLAYLALEGDRPHTRALLASLLWPDVAEAAALTNMRNTAYHLRSTLDAADPGLGNALLISTRQSFQLDAALLHVDSATFEPLYEQIKHGKETRGQGDVRPKHSQDVGFDVEHNSRVLRPNDHTPAPPHPHTSTSLQDWGEMPAVDTVAGRVAEQATLARWLVDERCRLVGVLGIGGVGKTTLAATSVRANAPYFDAVIWRSLLNAPPLQELLRGVLHTLFAGSARALPDSLDDQVRLLLAAFQRERCLLVLDNLESILAPGSEPGAMRSGYEGYAYLIQRLGNSEHQSCLLLTSREQPQALARLVNHTSFVRLLILGGLDVEAGHALLQQHGLAASGPEATALVEHYSGNPLALQIVANTIVDLFAGDVASFRDEAGGVFDTIRQVLDEQWERLSENEREVLLWLAIERLPVPLPTLRADLLRPPSPRVLLETVQGLRKRSLLEQRGPNLALQNVVTEYLTERLIARLASELEGAQLDWLHRYALLKADAPEYVRQSQLRVLMDPIARQLVATRGRDGIDALARRLLDALRAAGQRQPSYTAGTLLNLLVYLQIDLAGQDFSELCVWQADLRDVVALDVNFAGAAFASAAFTDLFDSVNSVAISLDSRLVAAGSNNGVVGVWRVVDGQRHVMLAGHATSVWSVAWSPDGALLASASDDGTVRLWSGASGRLVHTLHEQLRGIGALAFVPGTALLATLNHDGTVLLWDTHDLSATPRVVARPKHSGTLTVSASDTLVATCDGDGLACVWRVTDGQLLYALSEHPNTLRLAFSPDGRLLATGHNDGNVRVWEAATGQLMRAMEGHAVGISIYAIAWRPTGEQLATGGSDATIRVWDGATGHVVRVLRGNTSNVNGLAWSLDGTLLASAGNDETVRLWSIGSGNELRVLRGHAAGVVSLAFGSDAAALATTQGHVVRIWDMERRRLRFTLRGHRSMVSKIVWSRDGALLAGARVDGTVWVWDATTRRLRHALENRGVRAADFSPAGTLLALGGEDGVVRLWEMGSGSLVKQLEGHTAAVEALCFSPDDELLYSASNDGSVRVWEVASGRERARLRDPQHQSNLLALAVSPDGRLLAHNASGGSIIVWDVQRGEQQERLSCGGARVARLAWSPDGTLLASGSADFTVRVWDVQRGTVRASGAQQSWVSAVVWSPDGTLLVSSSTLGEIALWDGRTGARIGELRDAGPYAGTNIAGAVGLTDAQRAALRALGAVERDAGEQR